MRPCDRQPWKVGVFVKIHGDIIHIILDKSVAGLLLPIGFQLTVTFEGILNNLSTDKVELTYVLFAIVDIVTRFTEI